MNKTAPKEPMRPNGAGVQRGLRLTLNNNVDDYFFSTFPAIGFTVQIFYPNDFPDKMSGSLSEAFINAGTEALISMEFSMTKTSEARRCKFQSERKTIFGPYRYSDCLVECKIRSMQSLCNCVPFTVPVLEEDDGTDRLPLCTLIDIPCLHKYKAKWSRYYPNDPNGVESDILRQEKHDSINCPECLPDCNSIAYQPSVISTSLHNER
ncbi:unnamed protein product [Phaedon cochleariae]|uniref:Uncharacterized protein n=1 Tax=Phaedon cochleariae TaxID=80249 RepID=A0A9N9S9D5_PHACE|nr:unnamed protein product [Phaedon cochleariae]